MTPTEAAFLERAFDHGFAIFIQHNMYNAGQVMCVYSAKDTMQEDEFAKLCEQYKLNPDDTERGVHIVYSDEICTDRLLTSVPFDDVLVAKVLTVNDLRESLIDDVKVFDEFHINNELATNPHYDE